MESRSRLASPGVRAGSVPGPFGVRSGSVRGPCEVRSGSARGSFGVRSGSVRQKGEKYFWRKLLSTAIACSKIYSDKPLLSLSKVVNPKVMSGSENQSHNNNVNTRQQK